MTIKERRLIQGVVAGKSQTQAAIAAGYSPRSANEQASRALAKDNVRSSLERLMDREGLTERKLLQPIKEGMAAKALYQGLETPAPDHMSRLRSTEMAWKLRGKLLPSSNTTLNAPTQILIMPHYRASNGHVTHA